MSNFQEEDEGLFPRAAPLSVTDSTPVSASTDVKPDIVQLNKDNPPPTKKSNVLVSTGDPPTSRGKGEVSVLRTPRKERVMTVDDDEGEEEEQSPEENRSRANKNRTWPITRNYINQKIKKNRKTLELFNQFAIQFYGGVGERATDFWKYKNSKKLTDALTSHTLSLLRENIVGMVTLDEVEPTTIPLIIERIAGSTVEDKIIKFLSGIEDEGMSVFNPKAMNEHIESLFFNLVRENYSSAIKDALNRISTAGSYSLLSLIENARQRTAFVRVCVCVFRENSSKNSKFTTGTNKESASIDTGAAIDEFKRTMGTLYSLSSKRSIQEIFNKESVALRRVRSRIPNSDDLRFVI